MKLVRLAFFFLSLAILILTCWNVSALGRPQKIPDQHSAPGGSRTSPGVGFDLTTSYGTAAVRYHNFSIQDIGKIDGNLEYQNMMFRLSNSPEYSW